MYAYGSPRLPPPLASPAQLPEFYGALDIRKPLMRSMACLFADLEAAQNDTGRDAPAGSDAAQLTALAEKAREIETLCEQHAPAPLRTCDFRLLVTAYLQQSPRHGLAELERRVRLIVMRIKASRSAAAGAARSRPLRSLPPPPLPSRRSSTRPWCMASARQPQSWRPRSRSTARSRARAAAPTRASGSRTCASPSSRCRRLRTSCTLASCGATRR